MTAAVALATTTVLFLSGSGWTDADYVPEVIAPFVTPIVAGSVDLVPVRPATGAAVRAALAAADGPAVVFGLSQGADTAREVRAALAADPAAPPPSQLSFVVVGDPGGPGGLRDRLGMAPAPVDSAYDLTDVYGEYDPWRDFPDRLNPLAIANAVAALPYVHMRYDDGVLDELAGLEPTSVETSPAGGTTTTYRIPTKRLPLAQALDDLGVDSRLVDRVEGPLRTAVDAGYSRNDAQTRAALRKAAADTRSTLRKARADVRAGVRSTVRKVRDAVSGARRGGPASAASSAGADSGDE
ncbi:hydrolase [Mycobacterium phage Validus]|uniref:Hydrolase n=1 Tax=Mycobacterium phage Validus TaxID=1414747 RepID=V5UPZ7_9CAUD|nr:DNA binding protein [Mycobacterium phage Validus]AHB79611.1 hydrolase [Mycobacterium phage Validus]